MRLQTIVWTVLPNGVATTFGHVNLSVFVTPQLQTDEDGAFPSLSSFPDFVDWPKTLEQPHLTFDVVFQGHPPIVIVPNLNVLSQPWWLEIFNAAKTGVTSYKFTDYSTTPIHSFS